MNKEKKFVPVMLTPFKEDGNIDFEGLTVLTNYYLDSGAGGLFANCQSSEMFDLAPEERLSLVAHILKIADGKVPVVATGNFGDTLEDQAAFIKKIYSLGVQAVIVLTSLLVKQDEPEALLESNAVRLLELTGNIPLGFYECPVPYKRILSPQLLGKLVQTGRIIYHKDTCLDIEQVREKNRICADVQAFGLYDAYMVHAVQSLQSGSAGLSCIQGNYFPELVVWLCQNFNDPAMEKEVEWVQQFFINEMDIMHKNYPQSAKYYLTKMNKMTSTYVRSAGNGNVSPEVMRSMSELRDRYMQLLKKISTIKASYVTEG